MLYESPHRIVKLLETLAEIDPERYLLVGREITKIHEEWVQGTAAEVAAGYAARPSVKGEFAVLVNGRNFV